MAPHGVGPAGKPEAARIDDRAPFDVPDARTVRVPDDDDARLKDLAATLEDLFSTNSD